jgi:DNA-binding transcriptional LysR family regulator
VQESTISRRIRDLENHLGASLFIRYIGGVRLTIAGQKYVQHARKALRQIGQGAKDVAAIGRSEEGRVRIGIFSSLASGFLFELLKAFDRKHTHVRIEFVDGETADHIAAVRQLRLDVAFITEAAQWSGYETDYLWSERVFVVLPTDHPCAEKDELTWQDLAGERFIVSDAAPGQKFHDYLVQRLADLGHHPEIDLQYVSRDNLLSLVAIRQGLTLTSEAATVMPGVTYRPVANEIPPFGAVWSPMNDNPACRRMLSLARTMSRLREEIE